MEEENKPLLIKDMDEADRPREKAMTQGFASLSHAELMAIIFATGIQGKNVVDLCQEIIDDAGGLYKVTQMSVKQLSSYKGIGKVKAITLLAAMHLGMEAAKDGINRPETVFNTPEIAYDAMRHHFYRLKHEEFWILLIDRAGHKICEERISHGGTSATTVDIKIILKHAIENLASSIILFHNHPSGTLRPSIEDDKLTKKIVEAARLIDVRVPDHLIISDKGFYSYADEGRI